jgi:hypothetical protein
LEGYGIYKKNRCNDRYFIFRIFTPERKSSTEIAKRQSPGEITFCGDRKIPAGNHPASVKNFVRHCFSNQTVPAAG